VNVTQTLVFCEEEQTASDDQELLRDICVCQVLSGTSKHPSAGEMDKGFLIQAPVWCNIGTGVSLDQSITNVFPL
jgi:hypothetical protein